MLGQQCTGEGSGGGCSPWALGRFGGEARQEGALGLEGVGPRDEERGEAGSGLGRLRLGLGDLAAAGWIYRGRGRGQRARGADPIDAGARLERRRGLGLRQLGAGLERHEDGGGSSRGT